MTSWNWTDVDTLLVRQLQARLPARVFDFHAHLYLQKHGPHDPLCAGGPAVAGIDEWRARVGRQLPKSDLTGGLFFAMPFPQVDLRAANEFLIEQISSNPANWGLLLVKADTEQKELAAALHVAQIRGFKPYHVYGAEQPTFNLPASGFIPEWTWEAAQQRGWFIMLHIVRDAALADESNQRYIREHCRQYPDARLILAHAGRSFHSPHTVHAARGLRDLDNVFFDTSAICEAAPIAAILREFGPRRLLWGSDFPVSELRGRAVTLGTGFAWLEADQPVLCGQSVLVGLESLRAILEAADQTGMSEDDLADIFGRNAERLLDLSPVTSNETQDRYRKAKQLIPGGTQLLSKRPEMFAPGQWPAYFREARGCEVVDLDGRRYWDVSIHAIGACLLGYRDPDVTRAVQRQLTLGSFSTLNSPDEVELAELLCTLHPWAEQARFGRSGGEMMAVAVRIARATTDRSRVAVCGYHGWHDWYLAANLGDNDALSGHLLPGLDPHGVPRELRGTTFPFRMNDRAALQQIIENHGGQLAAVVMEPCRYVDPDPGFLEFVREAARRVGALVIFDEITIGWRLLCGGAHLKWGVIPDMAVFAKALGNGHPMAAVIGTRAAMEGGHSSFISSTYWTEGIGPAAALATIHKMQQVDLPSHCARVGRQIQEAWQALGRKHGLPVDVPAGYPALAHFAFQHELSAELKTLYVQEMLRRGFLATTAMYVTLAHTEEIVERYTEAIDAVFEEIAEALGKNEVAARLQGPVAHDTFSRLL